MYGTLKIFTYRLCLHKGHLYRNTFGRAAENRNDKHDRGRHLFGIKHLKDVLGALGCLSTASTDGQSGDVF